jgi:DNA-binding MarR family transcriptional regulator
MKPDLRTGYLIKKAQLLIRTVMNDRLRSLRVTLPQYAALSALERSPGLSNAELARECFVTAQTMIRISQSLENAGLLRRSSHPTNARILQEELTPLGHSTVTKCHKISQQIEVEMLSGVGEKEQRALSHGLMAILENLGSAKPH